MKTELSAYRFTSAAWDRSLSAGTGQDWSISADLTRPTYLTNLDSGCAFVKPTIDDTLIRMDASMAMFMGNYFDVRMTLPQNPRKMLKYNLHYSNSGLYRYNQVGEGYMPTVMSGDADLGALAVIQNYNQYYELQDYFVPRPGHVVYTPPSEPMKAEGPKFTRNLSSNLLDYAEYDEDGKPYLKTLLSYQSPGLLMHSGNRPPGPNTHGPNHTSQDVSPTRLNYVFPFTSMVLNNDVEFQRLRLKYQYEDPQISATWSNRGYTDSNQYLFFWRGMEDRNPELITSKAKGEVWVLYSNNDMNFVIACPAFDYYGIKEIKNPQYPTIETADVDVYVTIRTQLGNNSSRVFGKKMSLGFQPFTGVRWYGGQLSGNGNPPFRVWRASARGFSNILPEDMVSVASLSYNRSGLKARWNAGHNANIGWNTQDARTSFSVRLAGVHFVFKWRHPLISRA